MHLLTIDHRINTRCVVLMAQVHSVTLLPIKNPLSHEKKNNRRLLEMAITFERQGFFTPPHITDFTSYGE